MSLRKPLASGNLDLEEWPLGIGYCDACRYKDRHGSCQCFPYYIPMAWCSPCCLIGRIQSGLDDEEALCCDMGFCGWSTCCVTAPVAIWGPLGGMVFFSVLAPCYREKVRSKHNLRTHSDGDCHCCCGDNCVTECCEAMWVGCHYPCVFFQLYMTIREHRAPPSRSDGGNPSITNPRQ